MAFAACFTKPDAPSLGTNDASTADGDVPHDARPCLVRDNFGAGDGVGSADACGTWGEYAGSGSHIVTRSMQRLMMYSSSSDAGTATCEGTVAVPFTSVVVQIVDIIRAAEAKTGMRLTFGDSTRFTLEIASSGNAASVNVINNTEPTDFIVSYSNTTMQYFRIAKRPNGIELAYSPDAATWPTTHMFTSSSTLDTVRVDLFTVFGPNLNGFSAAVFDNLDACAP